MVATVVLAGPGGVSWRLAGGLWLKGDPFKGVLFCPRILRFEEHYDHVRI